MPSKMVWVSGFFFLKNIMLTVELKNDNYVNDF